MLDNRIYTFLELCNVMNYHKTAENLNMTQPAVTQHIKFLEDFYDCKLFDYSERKLKKTAKAVALEKYTRNIISESLAIKNELLEENKIALNIGATKTIGEYTLIEKISNLIADSRFEVNFIIDNTENLLNKLNHFELDLLLLEGYLDKNKYLHEKISDEEIVGICSTNHKFANKEVELEDVFAENIIFREKGSGTRNVFENFLQGKGYSLESFKNKSVISSNKIIENLVERGSAISFVYSVLGESNENISNFRIKNNSIFHEFNYVFINSRKAEKIIELIKLTQN